MTRLPTPLTAGAVTLAVAALGCFTLPLVAPHDPYRPDPMNAMLPPGPRHWLGTDQLGRDLLTRTAAAGRTSLLFALAVTTVTTAIGTVTGAIAGLAAGRDRAVPGPGWAPPQGYSVRECLLVILSEEWEYRIYADRDLAVLEARG